MPPRPSRFASQAALEELLRFGPETDALQQLMRQAESSFQGTVQSARSGAQQVGQAVERALPQVAAAYDQAGLRQAQVGGVFQRDLAALGPVADSIKAGASFERAGSASRLAESRAVETSGLAGRAVAATQGAAFAETSGRRQLATELAKILERQQSLARERGAFTALTTRQLQETANERALRVKIEQLGNRSAERRAQLGADSQASLTDARLGQQERSSLRSAGINPDTGQPIPGGPLTRGRERARRQQWAPQASQARAQDTIGEALREAERLRSAGLGRSDVAAALSRGREARRVALKDPQTGRPLINRDGTPRERAIAGVPQIKSQLLLSAALDMAYDGHLSRRNQQLLHRRGIQLEPLGVTTYGEFERRRRGVRRPPLAPGANGQNRPT